MKRTLNYTGRKKINKENIKIALVKKDGNIDSFSLIQLDLNEFGFSGNSKIYIEAYYRTELKRFDFGTISERFIPEPLTLKDIAYRENLRFRVLIVDPLSDKIIAHAVGIRPEGAEEKRSILPVEFKELGNLVWRVEYEGEEDSPILCLNKSIPNIENLAKEDVAFFVYVYSGVIREILYRMVFVDGVDSIEDPSIEWHGDWLRFASYLGVNSPRVLNKDDEEFEKEDALEWIESVVIAFCDNHSGKFRAYLKKSEENL